MSRIDLVVRSPFPTSMRSMQAASMFELDGRSESSESWSFDFSPPDKWSIGVIVGPSGSGKSTVARSVYGDAFVESVDWTGECVIDGFPEKCGVKQVTAALSRVGFSSPPAWFRPYAVLSTGQKFRADVARVLVDDRSVVAFDEFTSVVDRTVAQVGSAAVAKAIRKTSKRFVAVTCHYDVIEWLQPDWVLEMPSGTLTRREVQQRPSLDLTIRRTTSAAWDVFRPHHYLDHALNKASACYVAELDGSPVAFVAVLAFPHAVRPGWRTHRTVCLPDFQGVGIGNALSEAVCSAYAATGRPVRSTTSHPAMVRYRARSRLWQTISKPKRSSRSRTATRTIAKTTASGRYTASFEYVGPVDRERAAAFGINLNRRR